MKLLASLIVPALFVGCAQSPDIEDGENDTFTTDGKADGFGVEDFSPDGAAVLRTVSTFSADKLESEVGLSKRVADAIVAKRETLPNKKFTDLADLDAAKWVGASVFHRLLQYATDHKLYRTSIRIPLLVQGGDLGESITQYNAAAHAAGLTAFATYTFVDAGTKYSAKADAYNTRLEALAAKANIGVGEMVVFGYGLSSYANASLQPCYIGDPAEVADTASAQADDLLGDMYSIWGWKAGKTKWVYQDSDESGFGTDWTSYKTTSTTVLIKFSNSDDGDDNATDVVPACR
jgi:hypothetical protein